MEKNNLTTGKTTVKQAEQLLFNQAKAYSVELAEIEYEQKVESYEESMRDSQ